MFEEIKELIENKKYQEVKNKILDLEEADIADILCKLETKDLIKICRLIPKDTSAEVFSYLPLENQQDIINSLSDKEAASIIDNMYADDATDLMDEMPANVVKRLLAKTTPETRRDINLLLKYPDTIVNNTPTTPINKFELGHNLLVSFVKTDNMDQYLDHSARIYYTGKQFPSTIALNKLYYFMPYIKGKGVKDLYLIKIARIGTKKEARPECTDDDLRLVFEIEFIQELFKEYKMIRLNIKRTFVDTTINKMLELI